MVNKGHLEAGTGEPITQKSFAKVSDELGVTGTLGDIGHVGSRRVHEQSPKQPTPSIPNYCPAIDFRLLYLHPAIDSR
jgi:hypothetical protein